MERRSDGETEEEREGDRRDVGKRLIEEEAIKRRQDKTVIGSKKD